MKAALLKDTGSANLPNELFENVPMEAVSTLYFMGGRVKILDLLNESLSYKIEALTEVRRRVVLID